MFAEWLKLNEHIWLFWQLNIEIILGSLTFLYILKEYYYDAAKDEAKKQRKTRTTKKVTETKDGGKVTEEIIETEESSGNKGTTDAKVL